MKMKLYNKFEMLLFIDYKIKNRDDFYPFIDFFEIWKFYKSQKKINNNFKFAGIVRKYLKYIINNWTIIINDNPITQEEYNIKIHSIESGHNYFYEIFEEYQTLNVSDEVKLNNAIDNLFHLNTELEFNFFERNYSKCRFVHDYCVYLQCLNYCKTNSISSIIYDLKSLSVVEKNPNEKIDNSPNINVYNINTEIKNTTNNNIHLEKTVNNIDNSTNDFSQEIINYNTHFENKKEDVPTTKDNQPTDLKSIFTKEEYYLHFIRILSENNYLFDENTLDDRMQKTFIAGIFKLLIKEGIIKKIDNTDIVKILKYDLKYEISTSSFSNACPYPVKDSEKRLFKELAKVFKITY